LSSQPVPGFGAESSLQILDWSELITGPKVFYADAPAPQAAAVTYDGAATAPVVEPAPPPNPGLLAARAQLVRDIGRTRFRHKVWISLATAEALFLLVAIFKFQ